jgi:hypothetical protein
MLNIYVNTTRVPNSTVGQTFVNALRPDTKPDLPKHDNPRTNLGVMTTTEVNMRKNRVCAVTATEGTSGRDIQEACIETRTSIIPTLCSKDTKEPNSCTIYEIVVSTGPP